MKIEITKLTSWKDVLNSARFTRRKELLNKEPSTKFKKNIIKAEHSPLRCLIFFIDIYDIPYYTSVHFVRHIHTVPFVSTSRPDTDGNQKPREEQKKIDPVNIRLLINAEEIINISRKRLCTKTEVDTRKVWNAVIEELEKIEPELAHACIPHCTYRGFCPEIESCNFTKTKMFNLSRTLYLKQLNEE